MGDSLKKICTAWTEHQNWCDCGRDTCWEEQLRLRVSFDNNPNREVCILFIHRMMATAAKEAREKIVHDVESTIAEFGDQGMPLVASILEESFHGKREVQY